MPFKHYDRTENRTRNRKIGSIASLYRNGLLQFRGTSPELLDGTEHVEAYYDEETNTIGLMPTQRTSTSLTVQRQGNGRITISLKAFAATFGISLDRLIHCAVRREETGMITIRPEQ